MNWLSRQLLLRLLLQGQSNYFVVCQLLIRSLCKTMVLHIDKTTIDVGSRKQKHTQTKSVDQLVVNIWAKCRLYRLIVIVLRDDDNSIRHLWMPLPVTGQGSVLFRACPPVHDTSFTVLAPTWKGNTFPSNRHVNWINFHSVHSTQYIPVDSINPIISLSLFKFAKRTKRWRFTMCRKKPYVTRELIITIPVRVRVCCVLYLRQTKERGWVDETTRL